MRQYFAADGRDGHLMPVFVRIAGQPCGCRTVETASRVEITTCAEHSQRPSFRAAMRTFIAGLQNDLAGRPS